MIESKSYLSFSLFSVNQIDGKLRLNKLLAAEQALIFLPFFSMLKWIAKMFKITLNGQECA